MKSFWLYLPPVHRSLLKEALKSEFQNLPFCVLTRNPCRCGCFIIVFGLFSVAVTVSTHLCVICHHFCCPNVAVSRPCSFWEFYPNRVLYFPSIIKYINMTWREKCRICQKVLVRVCSLLNPLPTRAKLHLATGNLSQRLVFIYSRQLERLHFWRFHLSEDLYIWSGSLSDLTQEVYFRPW